MGLGSLLGLPKIQSAITRVKTPYMEVFFTPLERSWSVDIQNGLAWTIWTFAAQVMVKRRAGSQTTIKSRNRPNSGVCKGSETHCWKALEESYNFGLDLVSIWVGGEKLWVSKIPRVQTETISRLHFGSPEKKSHLDANAVKSCKEYHMGEGGGFPRVQAVVSQVSPR
jgi:hypothetical protein